MTAGAGRFREETLAAEFEESRDEALQDWVRRSLEYYWESCGRMTPWVDAAPENEKTISEEKAS